MHASLCAKISSRAICKETSGNCEVINKPNQTGEDHEETENGKNGEVYRNDADDASSSENEPEEVMDGENAGCEANGNGKDIKFF